MHLIICFQAFNEFINLSFKLGWKLFQDKGYWVLSVGLCIACKFHYCLLVRDAGKHYLINSSDTHDNSESDSLSSNANTLLYFIHYYFKLILPVFHFQYSINRKKYYLNIAFPLDEYSIFFLFLFQRYTSFFSLTDITEE